MEYRLGIILLLLLLTSPYYYFLDPILFLREFTVVIPWLSYAGIRPNGAVLADFKQKLD